MSFPHYPTYKDSGVKWIGDIPQHWDVIRLKNVLKCRITDGPHTTPEFTDEGIPFLSVDGIQGGELNFEGCRYISAKDHEEYRKKAQPQRNDILMGKAASTGKIARVKTDATFSIWSPLALIRVDGQISSPEFYEQVLKSAESQSQIDVLCTSNTQKNISMDDIPRLAVAKPPLEEQVVIATFLDRETAKIDALIAEQQRLIGLLQEKRQAVISHAVTKGLNPDVPMKDSGVEWLGEVPEHWVVTPIKHVCKIGNGSTPNKDNPAYWQGGSFPWLTSTSVNDDQVATANAYVTEQALLECSLPIVKPPAVLVGITGQGKTRGMAATLRITCTINQHLAFLKPHSDSTRIDFLRSAIDNLYAYFRRDTDGAGSTKGAITCSQLGLYKVAVPPPIEQEEIEASIGLAQSAMSELMKDAERNVELLQERRSALISAAVTGQIDVRGLATGEEP